MASYYEQLTRGLHSLEAEFLQRVIQLNNKTQRTDEENEALIAHGYIQGVIQDALGRLSRMSQGTIVAMDAEMDQVLAAFSEARNDS